MNRDEQEWLSEWLAFQKEHIIWCWCCETPLAQRWGDERGAGELEEIAEGFVVYADPKTREPSLWLCRDDAEAYEQTQDKGRN